LTTKLTPPEGFPAGLSQPSLRALQTAGITRLEQVAKLSEAEFSRLHGVGPKSVNLICDALAAAGLSYAQSATQTD